jgi:hypothetical protein
MLSPGLDVAAYFVVRWRPLEAALAAIGSQAEAVQDCVEDEQDAGRPKPIDIEFLLSDIIPAVLNLSGLLPFYYALHIILTRFCQNSLSCKAEASYLPVNMPNCCPCN